MRLHPLPGGEPHERGGEDDARGRPVAAEKTAERGVGQSDGHQHEDRVDARFVDQLPVAPADFVQGEPVVEGVPAQGAQVGVAFETDRQGGNLHHAGDGFARRVVADREDRAFLETRQLNVDSLRLSDTLRIADHTRGVDAGCEQVGRVVRNEIEDFGQFLSGFHNDCKNSPFPPNGPSPGLKNLPGA